MGKTTPIEWCDSSVNPVMGCDGCELWIPGKVEHCYAGSLHKIRAGRPGYADQFEVPKLFPGRMAVAAAWNTSPDRTDKPWLHGPRKIFISDMGDALSRDVPLEYLRDEVIGAVTSENGRRHHWLWPTKQPQRMVKLAEMIGGWPENLWAMTSVTSAEQLGRVRHLLRVPAKVRGVSYEPALGAVDFGPYLPGCDKECAECAREHDHLAEAIRTGERPLGRVTRERPHRAGIDWLIVGGESGPGARPFDLEWARSVVAQCKDAGVAVFVKQLGTRPRETIEMKDRELIINGDRKTYKAGVGTVRAPRVTAFGEHNGLPFTEYGLNDRKGGDWSEWPEDLRLRQFPV
jgi:protein gp37